MTNGKMTEHRKIPSNVLYGAIGMLILIWIAAVSNNTISVEEVAIFCDRKTDLGCTLDMKEESFIDSFGWTDGRGNAKGKWFYVALDAGGIQSNYAIANTEQNFEITFPDFPELGGNGAENPGFNISVENTQEKFSLKLPGETKGESPYTLWLNDNLLYFRGIVRDLKTDEMVGRFDENEFQIVKPCGYSWNKDGEGVELIDRYGLVSFSIDIKQVSNVGFGGTKKISFRGYFKHNGYYYVYGEGFAKKTNSQAEALFFIKKIEPVFNHSSNSELGDRIKI